MTLWNAIVAFLVWLSADPKAVDLEAPKAAAAVAAARASMLVEAPSPPSPVASCDCGQTCVRGVWKPDGRIEQRCACKCKRCEAERAKATPAACTTGNCSPRASR